MTEKIYTASKVKHADMWKRLRAAGANIISTWIDEAGPGETDDFEELWERIRLEVQLCDVLVLYVEPGDVLKGGLVEVGMALAGRKPVVIVSPSGKVNEQVGSWVAHPLVSFADTVEKACGFAGGST